MPGNALTTASSITCPHGGKVIGVPSSPKLMAGNMPVLTKGDSFSIAGCPFTLPNGTPSPCVTIQWLVTDTKLKVGNNETLSSTSVGLCKAGTGQPQGTIIVASTQTSMQTT